MASEDDKIKKETKETEAHTEKNLHHVENTLQRLTNNSKYIEPAEPFGKIVRAVGTTLHSTIENVSIGDLCLVTDEVSGTSIHAEVVAFDKKTAILLPLGTLSGLSQKAIVSRSKEQFKIAVGDFLLGKILDGLGHEIGHMAEVTPTSDKRHYYSVMQTAPKALTRPLIDKVFNTGIKAIDMFITCGRGQRLAILAGPGIGKTTLTGMLVRGCDADVVVIALVGERGREVREFIDLELNDELKKKTVMVVSTSDRPPSEHVKSAYVAQTVAEYFRDQGKNVLLFMDSITRFARAQREVGLSAGEPISRGGFPPSVFLSFPRLMERAGNNEKGTITAFYTVLTEDESTRKDPIADEVKSIIDGHIVLSQKIAEKGHYPAINILTSLSRIADRLITQKQIETARKARLLLSKYDDIEFLLRVGEYHKGTDPLADEAIKKQGIINKFLQQGMKSVVSFQTALNEISTIISNP